MRSLNCADVTIYSSTFERTLGPVVNLACLVLPDFLVERFFNLKKSLQPTSITLDQVALEEFISSGNFEHHIYKTRVRYERLRQALIFKLKSELGSKIEIAAAFGGMSLSLRFAGDWSSANICAAAEISNLFLVSARSYYQQWSGEHDYILSFTRNDEPEWSKQIALFVQVLNGFLSAQTSFAPDTDTEDAASTYTYAPEDAVSTCTYAPEHADVTQIGVSGDWQQLPDCNQL
jgi:DNA-binding transcriptional MocR family regulator